MNRLLGIIVFSYFGCLSGYAGEEHPFQGKKHGAIGVVEVLQAYHRAPEEAEVVYALDLARATNGDLVIQEGKSARVHLWSGAGTYLGKCGGEGQGPGETEGLIRVAVGKSALYGYSFPGPITVWPRRADGTLADNREARKLTYEGPFSMIFRVFEEAGGKLLLAGHNQADDGMGPVTWCLLDPKTGTRQELKELTVKPKQPMWDLYSADGTQDLRICPPRVWSAMAGKQLWVGFGNHSFLQVLEPTGRLGLKYEHGLPVQMPGDEDVEAFDNTPIPILLKSLKELGLGHLKKRTDIPKAFFSYFVPFQGGDFLFFNTIFGGFNNVNYIQNGAEAMYVHKGKAVAGGRVQLAEDEVLYCIDDQVIRVGFDDEDLVLIERVRLGWLP